MYYYCCPTYVNNYYFIKACICYVHFPNIGVIIPHGSLTFCFCLIKTYISHCGFGLEQIYANETIMNNVHVLIHRHVIFLPKKGKSIKGREFEPLTGSICFFEQEPLPWVLRTGCFQERIRARFKTKQNFFFHNRTKIKLKTNKSIHVRPRSRGDG